MATVAVQSKAGAKVAAELNMVPGESELIKATRSHGCCFREEDNIVVTNQRVQFLWRKRFCGINLGSLEEAFDLDDLHFVTLNYSCGLCCCCCSGMTLTLNFSRSQANIQDWTASSKVSGCRRAIKLPRSQAQEAYNQLQNMLQQRSQIKARK